MLEARLAKLRQKKMKKSKDGTEEESGGIPWLRFLKFKREIFSSIDISLIRLAIRELAI
jgi:hypothetical protein